MSGYTDFSVGLVREEPCMIPIDILVKAGTKKLKRKDYEWQRLISSTGQWSFLSQDNYLKVVQEEKEEEHQKRDLLENLKKEYLQ